MSRLLAIIILAFGLAASAMAVAVDEKPLADPAQEALARELMKEIRCLVCQNQSIEDSNAELARDLRAIVRERIALGDSPDNVRAYLVDRYGDWVLLRPPVKVSTYFLWASPFFVVLIILVLVMRRRHTTGGPVPLSDDEAAQLKSLLENRPPEDRRSGDAS